MILLRKFGWPFVSNFATFRYSSLIIDFVASTARGRTITDDGGEFVLVKDLQQTKLRR